MKKDQKHSCRYIVFRDMAEYYIPFNTYVPELGLYDQWNHNPERMNNKEVTKLNKQAKDEFRRDCKRVRSIKRLSKRLS